MAECELLRQIGIYRNPCVISCKLSRNPFVLLLFETFVAPADGHAIRRRDTTLLSYRIIPDQPDVVCFSSASWDIHGTSTVILSCICPYITGLMVHVGAALIVFVTIAVRSLYERLLYHKKEPL